MELPENYIPFDKYQGLGNDFIILDLADEAILRPEIFQLLANRRLGVGCDQIMVIMPANASQHNCDARIRIFNTDGSEAEACGNGTRCVIQVLAKKLRRSHIILDTKAGVLSGTMHSIGDVEVEQGRPRFKDEALDLCAYGLPGIVGHPVDIGNPHLVIFFSDDTIPDFERLGAVLEHHPKFENRTNVEFCCIDHNREQIRVWMWERGAGRTLACGSGACATAFVALKLELLGVDKSFVTIQMEAFTTATFKMPWLSILATANKARSEYD
ncbi:hypothetical protein TCAL_09671 [Tigriopus californicus]|uniref:diaminopimelate epimerase n=1 Tax=Tigriopus californicus TaxID=6832 RepID=A0A553NVU6_TIGCA|nr:hypothetical protein TCAL_09671 [Tigriopus californicus]|eukprot:TCALIF_09671-PA protein Name:"Similar to dapF Diaminopimelate epimerase (Psychrobacter sp. (strain PRwf-1))" AED:0.09 eAED:0.09 QI:0/0/0/0.5/1/1/2/0/269